MYYYFKTKVLKEKSHWAFSGYFFLAQNIKKCHTNDYRAKGEAQAFLYDLCI